MLAAIAPARNGASFLDRARASRERRDRDRDRRFFDHPGVDPIGAIGAIITNLRGNRPYLVGGSTLTQQIIKNTFLTPQKTLRRKLHEQFMALVLESQFTKMQILELYLNDVVLGQRGPSIHGAKPRIFSQDVSNARSGGPQIAVLIITLATLALLIRSARSRRRNVVLQRCNGKYSRKSRNTGGCARRHSRARNEAPYLWTTSASRDDHTAFPRRRAVDVYTPDLRFTTAQEAVATAAPNRQATPVVESRQPKSPTRHPRRRNPPVSSGRGTTSLLRSRRRRERQPGRCSALCISRRSEEAAEAKLISPRDARRR